MRDETLRLEIRVKNARLIDAIYAFPLPSRAHTPQTQILERIGPRVRFCLFNQLAYAQVTELCTLRAKPNNRKTGAPRKIVCQLATILECSISWLFPAELYDIEWPRALALDVVPGHFLSLLDAPVSALLLPPTQEEGVRARELRELLQRTLATLTPRQEKVLRARFGLDDGNEQTLREIADRLKVTVEGVRQIEVRALRHLRQPGRSEALYDFHE